MLLATQPKSECKPTLGLALSQETGSQQKQRVVKLMRQCYDRKMKKWSNKEQSRNLVRKIRKSVTVCYQLWQHKLYTIN